MKVVSAWEYGLRCLLQVAKKHPDKAVTIPQIATKEGLSIAYVGKLMHMLLKKGLIKSKRGRFGGYALFLEPSEISIHDIFQALSERSIQFEDCNHYKGILDKCIHINNNNCMIKYLWKKLDFAIEETLSSITLRDLIEDKIVDTKTVNNI